MKNIILTLILFIIAAFIAIPYWLNKKTPQPSFTLIQKDGSIELRHYNDMLIATTYVSDDRSSAINTGFKRLAGYIFGRHDAIDQRNIPMTAPVTQKKKSNQQPLSIPMTAPVIQSQPNNSKSADNQWEVAFVMPEKFNKDNIPKPTDNNIFLIVKKPQRYLTIQFTGLINTNKLERKVNQLKAYAQQHKISITGEPIMAFYDPPWIFPWLKRHEIWIQVIQETSGATDSLKSSY